MKTEQYKLKRRLASQGMRTRIQFKEDVIASLKHKGILFLTAALLIMCAFNLSIYKIHAHQVDKLHKQNASIIADLRAEKEKTIRISGMLATVMNGGSLFDRNSDTAFFFDKPTQVKLGG